MGQTKSIRMGKAGSFLLLAAMVLPSAATAQASTGEVAARFRAALEARDFNALSDLYAEDVLFRDETAGSSEPELMAGIRGRAAVISKERSWGETEPWTFDVEREFASGTHGLFQGMISIPGFGRFPFTTVIRVVDGRITERQDYGDYSGHTALVESDPAHPMATLARDYMVAYSPGAFDRWATFQTSDVRFRDSSAGDFWAGVEHQTGPEATIAQFNQALPPGSTFVVAVQDTYYAPGMAIVVAEMAMEVRLTAGGTPVSYTGPLIVVLHSRDGRVSSHRDYWDAAGYGRAMGILD